MEIEIEKQNNNCEIRNGLWLPKPTISQWPNDQQKHLREKYRNKTIDEILNELQVPPSILEDTKKKRNINIQDLEGLWTRSKDGNEQQVYNKIYRYRQSDIIETYNIEYILNNYKDKYHVMEQLLIDASGKSLIPIEYEPEKILQAKKVLQSKQDAPKDIDKFSKRIKK